METDERVATEGEVPSVDRDLPEADEQENIAELALPCFGQAHNRENHSWNCITLGGCPCGKGLFSAAN